MHLLPLLLVFLLSPKPVLHFVSGNLVDQITVLLPLPIHFLRSQTGSAGATVPETNLSCSSWQFGVETNNLRGWKTVPASCESYIGHYMLGQRYRDDSCTVTSAAAQYARGFQLSGDGKDVWVFDIDETSLSNLPYYALNGFGVVPYNSTLFNEWVAKGEAPPLPESLKLYMELLSMGIKIVFLTGRMEVSREITTYNLKQAGYYSWEKLILKGNGLTGTALEYKSLERLKLVNAGYRIVGNIGDQWSDILGAPEGERTFKLPDPLYYIG